MSIDGIDARGRFSSLQNVVRRLRSVRTLAAQTRLDIEYINASGMFDPGWYLGRYPDVAASGIDPVEHYVRYGAAEGRDPCGSFNTEFYLKNNPDVVASRINPFRHYLEYGIKEGRKPVPGARVKASSPLKEPVQLSDAAVISASGMFDRDYYLTAYPDVAKAGKDPIHHYVRYGANEGRNPCADFDTWFYLRENPDVALSDTNPFRHYIEHGIKEGRAAVPLERRRIISGPLVSIIVPVYAVEKYLAECLRSIVNQTYRSLEIIVVDDGSPDRSYEIASAYARADRRISVVRRENGGLGAARNTGVAEARGRYLTFVDSDDILPRDGIARMVSSLQRTGSDFVVGAMRRLRNGRLMPPDGWVKEVHSHDRLRIQLRDFPEVLTDVFACNKLFDSNFFRQEVGRFPEGIRYEDQEPTARAYRRGVFDVLASTVYHWRIREDGTSITQNKSNLDDLRDRLIVKQRVSRILADEDASIYEAWLIKAIGFDLRPYFEQVPRTDMTFFNRLREGMLPLADQMSPRLWREVRMIDRLPALAVLAGNRDDVIVAITRRAEYGYFVPGKIHDGAAYLDRKYLEEMRLSPEDDLLRFGNADLSVTASVTSLSWHGGLLRLEGYAFLTNLEFDEDSWVSARLVSESLPPVELSLRQQHCPRVDCETKDAWNAHADSGFIAEVDPVALGLDPAATWRLEITVGRSGLDETRSLILRDVDFCGIPDAPAVSAIRDGCRWFAEFEDGLGFVLRCAPLVSPLMTSVNIDDGEIVIAVDRPAETLLLVCETLRRRMRVPAATGEVGPTVFRFTLPDVSRRDNREHLWHMRLCSSGEFHELTCAGDVEGLERECPEHHRTRVVMDRRGTLLLRQVNWFAVADEVDVDETTITIRGRADVPGASALSARFAGETQELTADYIEYDAAAQRFALRIPFDPAINAAKSLSKINGPALQGGIQPTMLHGFSLRLSAVFQGQKHERWVRVARGLQCQLPADWTAARYGITFTRTAGSSSLWLQFRLPYRQDERGRLAQNRLHFSTRNLGDKINEGRSELQNAILFESFSGSQVSDSVLAICDEVIRRRLGFDLYWTVADLNTPVPEGTTPLLIHSRDWIQQLHRVRYLVNNNNFPFYFRKRPGQVYLQTWHGTPLKRIGNHVPQANLSLPYRQLMQRESRYWDFLLAQNDYAAEVLAEAFDYSGEVLNVGYPRNDVLAGSEADMRRLSVRNRFGFEPYHFVVLYAPTWRDNLSGARGYGRVNHLDSKLIRKLLGESARLILRGHHNTARDLADRQANVIDATHYPDINDLLLASDLLITDYSSVMFDYVVTGKPIVFLTPDLEEYRDQTRGFYMDLEEIAPGPVCRTNEELSSVLLRLGEVVETYSGRYREFTKRFASRDDGAAAVRVVDAIWGDSCGRVAKRE